MKIIKKLITALFCGLFGFFAVTQIIYWFNLDNKFIFGVVYPILQKHYDKVKRNKKF